ncbi:MAG: 4'-phosphopantetheinyl transferase superfamily protein [Eubacterium sp.]|nr:4'-phosphopantetheinyl transferase superfamily protein [Clostridia bacterium]MCI9145271.1 4'-phosphopantetheinyl transferase superfamily protein [Eubacterium sp.]
MSFDLYIAGIDEIPNDDFTETISEYRLKKAKNYKNEDDRKLSILSSLLLDKALKKHDLSERDMKYTFNAYGKPYFANAEDLHFSISHSGEYAMVVLSDKEIGCDIQQIKDINLSIADRFFTAEERKYVKCTEDFFRIWTLKESFIKAIGKGLALPLNSFSIKGLDSDKSYCEYNRELYEFKEFDKMTGYCIAVCEVKR